IMTALRSSRYYTAKLRRDSQRFAKVFLCGSLLLCGSSRYTHNGTAILKVLYIIPQSFAEVPQRFAKFFLAALCGTTITWIIHLIPSTLQSQQERRSAGPKRLRPTSCLADPAGQ